MSDFVEGISISTDASRSYAEEVLHAKVEHLERDRVNLTLQLHNRTEKDRERKMKEEKMTNDFKTMEAQNTELAVKLRDLKEEYHLIELERDHCEFISYISLH